MTPGQVHESTTGSKIYLEVEEQLPTQIRVIDEGSEEMSSSIPGSVSVNRFLGV
jgi:hypothetical protein